MKYYQKDPDQEWVKYLERVTESYNTTTRPPNICSPRELLFGVTNQNFLPSKNNNFYLN